MASVPGFTHPTLYLVATPIGTQADMSPRAKETIENVAFVACEDTRHTAKLLAGLHIRARRLESVHEHNEAEAAKRLVQIILEMGSAAIVTDAGTPCISDPGSRFVKIAREAGVRICSVPGPSALPAALAASGFLQPRSVFSQFLPRTTRDQVDEFKRWQAIAPCIAVFFESPQRIVSSLENLKNHFGEIEVCTSREISKMYEEHIAGQVDEVIKSLRSRDEVRGECVVCVNLNEEHSLRKKLTLTEAANFLLEDAGNSSKEAIKELAKEHSLSAKELYNLIQKKKT